MTAHAEFEDKIAAAAHQFGWSVMAVRPAIRGRKGGYATPWRFDGVGWPDLTLVKPADGRFAGCVVFAEVKIPPDKLTSDQAAWATRLRGLDCGACEHSPQYHVWTPADWPDIVALLSGGRASTTP